MEECNIGKQDKALRLFHKGHQRPYLSSPVCGDAKSERRTDTALLGNWRGNLTQAARAGLGKVRCGNTGRRTSKGVPGRAGFFGAQFVAYAEFLYRVFTA